MFFPIPTTCIRERKATLWMDRNLVSTMTEILTTQRLMCAKYVCHHVSIFSFMCSLPHIIRSSVIYFFSKPHRTSLLYSYLTHAHTCAILIQFLHAVIHCVMYINIFFFYIFICHPTFSSTFIHWCEKLKGPV